VLLAGLAPEQRPIAERLAAGGIPGVRRAIAEERERARSEGRPEVSGEAILALAEQLAPSVKQAIWLDRAEAVVAQLEQISLRDLRTTVASATPRDEAARELDRKLREELDRRVKKLRSHWEEQITHALEEGRVLQALRFSAQPPEPTARFPAALVDRLATAAGAAMTASTPAERWLALLDAAIASPIRRQIHPAGLPEDSTGEVVRRARLASGSLPALAPMVGLSMPPPPKPIPGAHPSRPPRPPARPLRRPSKPSGKPKAAADKTSATDAEKPDASLETADKTSATDAEKPDEPLETADKTAATDAEKPDEPLETADKTAATDAEKPAEPLEAPGAAPSGDPEASPVVESAAAPLAAEASEEISTDDSASEPVADEESPQTAEEAPSAPAADP